MYFDCLVCCEDFARVTALLFAFLPPIAFAFTFVIYLLFAKLLLVFVGLSNVRFMCFYGLIVFPAFCLFGL